MACSQPDHDGGMHELLGAATAVLPDVVTLRRDLHRYPELGLDNPATQARVMEALSDPVSYPHLRAHET